MKSFISDAIIMRTKEFGEADLLVTFLTPEMGLLKGVAKYALRSKKRFVNCLEHFCLVDVQFHKKKENQLYLLDSCKMVDCFEGLRSNYKNLVTASYMVEVIETLFPQSVTDPRVFELLRESFQYLSVSNDPDKIRIFFQGRAMALGGYAINFDKCCGCGRNYKGEGRAGFDPVKGRVFCLKCGTISERCPPVDPGTVKHLSKVQSGPVSMWCNIVPSPEELEQMKKVLASHMAYRIGKTFKSRKYLQGQV